MSTRVVRGSSRVSAALRVLRDRGGRVTPARRAILEVLESAREHLNADEIVHLASERAPGVHRATVYRALATLGEWGLVTHTHIAGLGAVYHLSVADPDVGAPVTGHAHLQCSGCGRVIDIPARLLRPLAAQLSDEFDFELAPHHAALLGSCATCRGGETVNPPPAW